MATLTDAAGKEIAVGTELGPKTIETGFHNWNRYAAVNFEFVPIHMDDAAGQEAGMPGAFGMGNLQTSILHNLAREWAGEKGRIKKFNIQWRKPNTKGPVTASGKVTAITPGENGETLVEIEAVTVDGAGDTLAPASITVAFA